MFQVDRKILIGAVLVLAALAWWFRFDVRTYSNGNLFLFDHWTHQVTVCGGARGCGQAYPHVDRQ